MDTLLESVFSPSISLQEKYSFINSAHFKKLENRELARAFEKVNILLSNNKESVEGLILLKKILQDSPTYCKNEQLIIMFVQAFQFCNTVMSRPLACEIVCIILKHNCSDSTRKSAFNNVFTYLVNELTNSSPNDECIVEMMTVLAVGLKFYPGLFQPREKAIESILLKMMQSDSQRIISLIADCFACLPACKGTDKKQDYEGRWRALYVRILNSLKALLCELLNLGQMLSDNMNEYLNDITSEVPFLSTNCARFTFTDNPDIFPQIQILRQRICALSCCLVTLTRTQMYHAVAVDISSVFDYIHAVFSIPSREKVSLEEIMASFQMPDIFCATLRVLESIIISFKSRLSRTSHRTIITQTLRQAIQHFNIIKHHTFAPHCTLYKVLTTLFSSGLNITLDNDILTELLKDMSIPEQKDVSLNVQPKHDSNHVFANQSNVELCISALEALTMFMYNSGAKLPELDYKAIYETVLDTVLQVQKSFLGEYKEEKCRCKLYELLLTLAINSKSDAYVVLTQTINIYHNATRDPSPMVLGQCQKAFTILAPLVAPPRIRLFDEIRPAAAEEEMEISEQNITIEDTVFHYNGDMSMHMVENLPSREESVSSEESEESISSSDEVDAQDFEPVESMPRFPINNTINHVNSVSPKRSSPMPDQNGVVSSEEDDDDIDYPPQKRMAIPEIIMREPVNKVIVEEKYIPANEEDSAEPKELSMNEMMKDFYPSPRPDS